MKDMGKTQFSFTIDRDEKERLELAAKDIGLTLTELLRTGASFYASFDSSFRRRIENFSKALNMPQYLVLQNLAISWMANREAHADVNGYEDPVLKEFMFTDRGPITGEALFNILKADEINNLEYLKERMIQAEAECGELTPEDADWLKKRQERLNQAAESQKRAKENFDKGLSSSYTNTDVKKSGLTEGEYQKKMLAEMLTKRNRVKSGPTT